MQKKNKSAKAALFAGGITLLTAIITHFILLFPINPKSLESWFFLAIFLAEFTLLYTMGGTEVIKNGQFMPEIALPKEVKFLVSSIAVIVGFVALMMVYSIPLFHAGAYTDLVGDDLVQQDISAYTPTIDSVPLLDKASAELLANRTMGSLVNEVSQYQLGDSTQITVQGSPIRVQPLEYAGAIKWFTNRGAGIPGYIAVDMQSQTSEIVRLDEGMKLSPSGYLFDNLYRRARYAYPFDIFDGYAFELDDNNTPYWVFPVIDHKIGLFGGTDIQAVVTLNAVTGEHARYKLGEIPDWVDNVYAPSLIMEQYDYYGSFQNGYINSIIGQKGVVRTTRGYNYIPKDNDLYIYTGVTSVLSDESNIGFIFANLRTKEVEYYEYSGAEEYSAAASAEGMVQNLRYDATFPLLLQIDGQPTYVVALKDDAGLVKMYGMVNVANYQIVATGDTISATQKKYRELMRAAGGTVSPDAQTAFTGEITDIRTANKEGSTFYYIQLAGEPTYYVLSVLDNEDVVLLNPGDTVTITVDMLYDGELLQEGALSVPIA